MPNTIKFGEGALIYPLVVTDGMAANDQSGWVDVSKAQWVTFLITIGTNDTGTGFVVEASSAASTNASSDDVAFWYRVSGAATSAAAGADTWLAITTADSNGFTLAEGDSNRAIIIDVDPSIVAAKSDQFRYLHVRTTATAYSTAPGWSVLAILEPRYSNTKYTT